MRRVVFANRFYWPAKPATGQLLTDLATGLAVDGWEVTVVCSRSIAESPRAERDRGVAIRRIWSPARSETTLVRKAGAFVVYAVGAWIELLRQSRRGEIVIIMTDPPLVSFALGLAARLRGARVVYWLQDLYPEIAAAVSGRRWLMGLTTIRNPLLRNADLCVAISRDLADAVRRSEPKAHVTVIENWAPFGISLVSPTDAKVRAFREQHAWEQHFIVGYSGNLGRVHELEAVIAAAEILQNNERVRFVLVGSGPRREALQRQVNLLRLRNVSFFDSVAREHLAESLASIDLHLVTLRRGCERYVYPSKFYGIVGAGRPVLFVGDPQCEMAHTVIEKGVGIVADSRSPASIADAILQLAENPSAIAQLTEASQKTAASVTAERGTARWIETLDSLRAC